MRIVLIMETETRIFRCIAYNSNHKKCRTRCPPNTYFCCEAHKPKNLDNLKEECCICCNEVGEDEIIQLKCGHVQHKYCYFRWINKIKKPSCPLCKSEFNKRVKPNKKRMKKKMKKRIDKKETSTSTNTFEGEDSSNNGTINNNEYNPVTPPISPPITPPIISDTTILDTDLTEIDVEIKNITKDLLKFFS